MFGVWLGVLLYVGYAECLWPKGVVHYMISQKDYDAHSQDIITSAFEAIEREVCVKFFHSPANRSLNGDDNKLLYISNPTKMKNCPPVQFSYNKSVVDMAIGYKCLNHKDVARIVVDMVRASIGQSDPIASYDMVKKYNERDHDSSTLLSPADRNYINSHYYAECGALSARPFAADSRRFASSDTLGAEAAEFYKPLMWPLGVVMYSVEPELRGTPAHSILKGAMTTIELSSCVVFQFHDSEQVLKPKNFLYFTWSGDDTPEYGFKEGKQSVNMLTTVYGAAGHAAHALNNLLRALGVPMTSNRYDRDNYVDINWKNVAKGKEHLLEKMPEASWVTSIPYDFTSATHAAANFACSGCELGATTVAPIQDHLWQRTLSMGRRATLSDADIKLLNMIYGKECQRRVS